MRRRALLAALACTGFSRSAARAAVQGSSRRIGFLGTATQAGYSGYLTSLRKGLKDLGWEEGQNIQIEYIWANSDYSKLPMLAQHLASSRPEVLITHGTPGTRALQAATRDIPIVMAVTGEAVASGLIESFRNPGGNTTGQSYLGAEMSSKRVELLLEASPSLKSIAAIYNSQNPFAKIDLDVISKLAGVRNVEIKKFPVSSAADFEGLFSNINQSNFQSVSIIHDSVLTAEVSKLAVLCLQYGLLSIGEGSFVRAGGLLGYGPDFDEMWRKTASYVDKILKGAHPNTLPVEVPTKFETLINLRTARALKLDFPDSLLARADELFE